MDTPKLIPIRSKYRGRCMMCEDLYQPGESVLWAKGLGCMHTTCNSPGVLSGYIRGFRVGYRTGLRDSQGDTSTVNPTMQKLKEEALVSERSGSRSRLFDIVDSVEAEIFTGPAEPAELSEDVAMGADYLDSLVGD